MAITEDLIIGSSAKIHSIRQLISKIADSEVTGLISGEPGTGKSLVALAIHQMSSQSIDCLMQFDCATATEKYLEIELFGSEESGHVRKGLLESANARTLLLENIDHAPLQLQIKLLHIFQKKSFSRYGGTAELQTDCRIIATSRLNMKEKVEASLLREDLFYRISVIPITIPALRDRPEDIEPLIYEFGRRLGKNSNELMKLIGNQDSLEYFKKYSWPGNVTELRQIVETLILTEDFDSIKQHLLGHINASSQMIIEKCITFPPEYHLSGVSILSFFGEIIRRKYPDHNATVRIEQEDLMVRMIIEPLNGKVEVIERALDEYGLVVTGRIKPEQYTDDPFLLMELKNELRIATARIESQRDLIQYQNNQLINQDHNIKKLMNILDNFFDRQQPQEIKIDISPIISPTISSTADVKININIIKDIQNDLCDLSDILNESGEDASSVIQVRDMIEKLEGSEAERETAMHKLQALIKSISNPESKIGKVIKTTKKGVAVAQSIAKHYNNFAQWLGWPQIPKPFLGNVKDS